MSAWRRQVVKLVTGGLLGLVLLSGRSGAIEPESRLEGWVRLASGQPAAGVQVRLFDLTDPRRSVGTTADEEGYFALAAPRLADARPQGFALLQNYPNPFNPSTIIPYQLPASTHVRLEVFNVLGQHVATLVDREQPAGRHTATWHGTDAAGRTVAAGLYLYRIRGTGPSETRRMVLVDGPVSAPGAAVAAEPPTSLATPEPTCGLTVSGRDVVTHVDPDFQVGVGPVEIVVEARATSLAAMKVTTSDRIWGDVDANGQVDIFDALLVGLYSLDPSIAIPNNGDITLGDVNRDGHIDITDAYLIATYSVNPTDPSLPAGIGTPVIVVAEGKMYWVDRTTAKIQRANLDGSQVEALVTTGLDSPWGLALDLAGGKMYWADSITDKIQRANLNGSQVEELLRLRISDNPGSLVLVPSEGKMYWTDEDWNEGRIQRANLDGTQVEDILTEVSSPAGLALDLATGKMYWTDTGRSDIGRTNLDGSQSQNLVTRSLNSPRALALDLAAGKMYWTDSGTLRMQRANFDGSQVEDVIVSGLGHTTIGLAIDPIGGKIYWTDWGAKEIRRANLDGTRVENLITGLSGPVGLALDIAVPDAPDLVAESPLANPPNPAPSQSFTLSVAIHNRGNAPAPSTTVRYYLSTDSTITTEDTEVGTGTVSELAAPSTIFKLIRLTAPSNLRTYYYGACVQPVSGESDIQNNCSSASEVVVVPQ